MMTNLIYSQNMNILACFLKDSFSKLLWRLHGMFGAFMHCTQVERPSSQKNLQAYQYSINTLAQKHQEKLSHLPNNGFHLELDSFYQKPQLSCHLQGSCLWFLLKPWPASWPFFMNAEYQLKFSNSQIKLWALPAKPWTTALSSVWPMPFVPPPTKPANRMKSKVMLSCTHPIWTCCLFRCAVAKL